MPGFIVFFLVAGVIFSVPLFAAGYYLWSAPQQAAQQMLGGRLRELRANMRARSRRAPELLRREHRGAFAFLGDLVTWAGVFRRLQTVIDQANLKYRAADVFGLTVALAGLSFLLFGLWGGSGLLLLRLLLTVLIGAIPVLYI